MGGFTHVGTYDELGYIATYTAPDGEVITYQYDDLGQLLSAVGDTTYTYTYDGFGNLLTANGHSYTYGDSGWLDLLTAYDGESITYDASGNPTSYYNGTRWTFGWAEGRNLVSASGGDHTVSYTYDHNGVRTTKTVDGVVHTYYYASGKLLRETYGSNVLDFFYDASGTPYALKYNNGSTTTTYYYITNLQGDVIRLIDANGNTAAYYEYDPYGNAIEASGSHATINPLRYRGYYYDSETELYYLQSRYYDPQVGRFINADALVSTGQGLLGNNMFAYCLNCPIIYVDASGTSAAAIALAPATYDAFNNSGLTKREFCQQRGISEKSFYYWLRKLRNHLAEAAGPQLVQIDPVHVQNDMLQIQYRGAELKLPSGVDIDAVAALLRSIQSL